MTNNPPYRVYTHGFAVRIAVCVTESQYVDLHHRLRLQDRRSWKPRPGGKSDAMLYRSGSLPLTGRAPRNRNLAMAKFNAAHGTHLYTLGIGPSTTEGTDHFVERFDVAITSTRRSDIGTTAAALGLSPHQWAVSGYDQLERYVVLSAPDAARVAERLDHTHSRATSGRYARKEYLVHKEKLPITIGTRTHVDAEVNLYRIVNGATGLWKMEAMLKSDRNRHRTLRPEDDERLDAALRALVADLGVSPIEKPSRWEPVDPDDDLWEPWGSKTNSRVYRGPKPAVLPASDFRNGASVRWVEPPVANTILGPNDGPTGVSDLLSQGSEEDEGLEGVLRTSPVLLQDLEPAPSLSKDPSLPDMLALTVGAIIEDVEHNLAPQADESSVEEEPTIEDVVASITTAPTGATCPPSTTNDDFARYLLAREICFGSPWVPPARRSREVLPWSLRVAEAIAGLPEGFLVEVVVDSDLGPVPCVDGLLDRLGAACGLRYLGPEEEIPYDLRVMMSEHHEDASPSVLAIVIDESVPFEMPTLWLEHWRQLIENHGAAIRVVMITSDARNRGLERDEDDVVRGKTRTPKAVRSTVDGATFFSHQRYRAELGPSVRVNQVVDAHQKAPVP